MIVAADPIKKGKTPRVDGIEFIINDIQGGRKRPCKYRHFIKIPVFLYDEMVDAEVIRPEDYFIYETAFFEYNEYLVTMNFITYTHIEDMHVRILNYLVTKAMGQNPIQRGGHSKL
jgi:hypothetical protein